MNARAKGEAERVSQGPQKRKREANARKGPRKAHDKPLRFSSRLRREF